MKKRLALLPLLLALALAAPAQDTNDYALRSDLAAYAERADLDSYATHSTLSNYALLSDLAAYAPLSALAGIPSAETLSAYALLSDLAAYATAADLEALASDSDLDNYATLADLAAATSSISNSFLPAEPRTSGSYTNWHVQKYSRFEEGLSTAALAVTGDSTIHGFAEFGDDAYFGDAAEFDGSITFGGETRTNWPARTSHELSAGQSLTPGPGDHIIWAYPQPGEDCAVYLPVDYTTNENHVATIIVRDFAYDSDAETTVYNVSATEEVTIGAGETGIFDLNPYSGEWTPR